MGELTIGHCLVSDMPDAELLAWMNEANEGYTLRGETADLWLGAFRVLDTQGPPMTVRGLFYGLEMLGLVQKSEAGYRKVWLPGLADAAPGRAALLVHRRRDPVCAQA